MWSNPGLNNSIETKRKKETQAATNRTRIAFLVSGEPSSAMGLRAAEFAKRLPSTRSIVSYYREGRRGQAIWKFVRQLGHTRPNLICVFDHSLDAVLAAVIHQARYKTPWILDTGDDILALGKALGRRGLALWMTRWLDRLGANLASHIVVRGRGHQELLSKRSIESTWIPDGFPLDSFRTSEQSLPPNPSIDYPLTVGVLGSSVWSEKKQMCYGQDLIQVVHHLQTGAKLDCPVRGVMIGDGTGIAKLQVMAQQLGVSKSIEFLGRRNSGELPRLITKWHIGLSTQTNDGVGHVRTTGKLPIYLACGRFIIASRVGEAARILPEEMLVDYHGDSDPNYPGRVADRIAKLVAAGTAFDFRSDSRAIAEQYFDYDKLASDYGDVLNRFLVKTTESR
jgi:glycosyltransferase involved in cell wall biosynthesis